MVTPPAFSISATVSSFTFLPEKKQLAFTGRVALGLSSVG